MTVDDAPRRSEADVETLDALDQLDAMEFGDDPDRDAPDDDAPDEEDGEIEDAEIDELDLLVEEYLDGELKGSERDEFESKMASDPELKKRVDDARMTFDVVEEFDDAPGDASATVELAERTVERLNAQARSELDSYSARERARKRRRLALQILAPVLLFFAGCAVFAALLPNPTRQRERDAAVVERLAQLEAAGDFNFLVALADANLFEDWKKTLPANPFDPSATPQNADHPKARSYAELVKDPVFYRLQRRFEALDPESREKYRALRKQIDASPERDKLLHTLDDYVAWLDASTNATERERIVSTPPDARIMEIRRRMSDDQKVRDFFNSAQNKRGEQGNAAQPRDDGAKRRGDDPGSALRAALPDALQNEDFRKIYDQYARYRAQKNAASDGDENRRDDVVEFLANVKSEDLADDFSPDAQKALDALDPERRSSLMGLIVSLSLLENDKKIAPSRPFQNQENPMFFAGTRRDSTRELAETLRKASQEERDLVTSLPPMEARGALMGLAWGFFSANPANTFGRNVGRAPGNNPGLNREPPRDAPDARARGAFLNSRERGEGRFGERDGFAPPEFDGRRDFGRFGDQPRGAFDGKEKNVDDADKTDGASSVDSKPDGK